MKINDHFIDLKIQKCSFHFNCVFDNLTFHILFHPISMIPPNRINISKFWCIVKNAELNLSHLLFNLYNFIKKGYIYMNNKSLYRSLVHFIMFHLLNVIYTCKKSNLSTIILKILRPFLYKISSVRLFHKSINEIANIAKPINIVPRRKNIFCQWHHMRFFFASS